MKNNQKNLIEKIIINQFYNILKEQNELIYDNNNIPENLRDKINKISIAYISGFIRFGSIKNLFVELMDFISDPMDIVNIIYNNIISAAKKYEIINKDKIKNTYHLLTTLARQKIEERGL